MGEEANKQTRVPSSSMRQTLQLHCFIAPHQTLHPSISPSHRCGAGAPVFAAPAQQKPRRRCRETSPMQLLTSIFRGVSQTLTSPPGKHPFYIDPSAVPSCASPSVT